MTAAPHLDDDTPHAWALRYAALGLRVVPIAPGKKRPTLPAWQDAATVDPATITAWWTGLYRDHGVGLAIGQGGPLADAWVFAVDIDQHGIDGEATLADLEATHGALPDTWEAITGGGGRHLLFWAEDEVRNGRLAPGVDIRGAGGQIVVEPTVHPSGQRYTWVDGASPWDCQMAEAPRWLIDALAPPEVPQERPTSTPAPTDAGTRPGDLWAAQTTWATILEADGWTYAGRGHEGEERWVRPGKVARDGISATVDYKGTDLLKVFTSSVPGLDPDSTYSKLGYLAAVHHHGDHGEAARALAAAGWTTNRPTGDGVSLAELMGVAADGPDGVSGGNPLSEFMIDWGRFWDEDHSETDWLLEPLFAAGRAHAIYAGAKTGKSYLVLAASAALASGRPFLHHPGGEPVSVLYVDYEMTAEDLHDRLTEFGYGPGDDLRNLHYALLPSLPPLNTRAGGETLVAAAAAVGARLVIIDTTGRATDGEENDNDVIRDYYRHTGLPLKRAGVTVARLDHAGKDSTKGQRGASAKNDDVDVVWKLSRRDAGQLLEATHRRMSWVPEKVEVDITRGADTTFSIAGAGSWPEGTRELARKLDELGVAPDASTRDTGRALREACHKASSDVVRAAVRYRKQRSRTGLEELQEARRKSSGAPVSDDGSARLAARSEKPHEMGSARPPARSAHPPESSSGAAPPPRAARSGDHEPEAPLNHPPLYRSPPIPDYL